MPKSVAHVSSPLPFWLQEVITSRNASVSNSPVGLIPSVNQREAQLDEKMQGMGRALETVTRALFKMSTASTAESFPDLVGTRFV